MKATPMRVTASTLRMHATPDAESPVTARLPQNAAVEVLDDPARRFVRTPAGLGWVHGDYLAAAPPAPKRRTWRVAKSLGVLLAHIDVVPANPADWSVAPFKLTERDGYFYGRGSGDDKYMAASFVANLIRYLQEGYKPDRDVIVALETDGG